MRNGLYVEENARKMPKMRNYSFGATWGNLGGMGENVTGVTSVTVPVCQNVTVGTDGIPKI